MEEERPPRKPPWRLILLLAVITLFVSPFVVFRVLSVREDIRDEQDMDRLFVDAQHLESTMIPFTGRVTNARDYCLEPSFMTLTVHERPGRNVDLVLNSSSLVLWPGASHEVSASGYPGEWEPPALSMREYCSFELSGTYCVQEIGKPPFTVKQAFLVQGAFSPAEE